MDFLQRVREYDEKSLGCDAIEDLAAFAKTFEDWRNVFYRTESKSIFEKTALFQMATQAKTFGHWLNVYQEAGNDSEARPIALTQMQRLADNPVDADNKKGNSIKIFRWTKILEICPRQSKEELLASTRLLALHLNKKEKQQKIDLNLAPVKI